MNVSLFATCLTDTFYPRAAIATVKVLEHLGCHVDFPAEQTCCGQPMFNNGFEDESRELARQMVRVLEHSDYVVTPSGSCAAMIREHYEELLSDDHAYKYAISGLVAKTYEFVEFLVNVLRVDLKQMDVSWPGKVTYHYSCHLRGIGVTDEAVQLMEQIDGLQYVPMEKMDQCCGFGGTFAAKYPQISGAVVNDKVDCIAQTGAQTVISNDAGCTMNISGACRRQGQDAKFKTLAEVIAEGMGLLE
ncbi:MAG: Fe-S oxidoreductase [Phycisphaeraceae bacterium]|nr:Fe-S oxidoreductase [Phycisphaeraceae bacterium]|tara:strand:+ start:324 stop:1061 length:738 start_codon:yes stop_codon:yes gene_type:complete